MKKEQYSPIAYEAPIVEVIEVEVEKGFASSGYPISGTVEEDDMGNTGGGMLPW